jgi:hypothetical protein
MNKLDYATPIKVEKKRIRFPVAASLKVISIITLAIGAFEMMFIMDNMNSYIRMAQLAFVFVMLAVQAAVGLIALVICSKNWHFPALSFGVQLANAVLLFLLQYPRGY